MLKAQITGPADALAAALCAAILPAAPAEAEVLLNLHAEADPEDTIAAAEAFAAHCRAGAAIVTLLRAGSHWPGARRLALIGAFTRHAALRWAPRRLRVNAIALGVPGPAGCTAGAVPAAPATPADVARVALALLQLPSITGQVIRLGAA